ncbi:FAD dependent oxidoreductase [Kockovaella imperatae]|uniref:FAD dependent oxidoreductase n=1 Tax=Kockovaella imperatae TaxID=4999 RepID=A0A1Y1UC07_9TREE|nr:FAD dependent oxidoreductase [Kockovaella imperatae]ORX35016.1 FAD dependent oxidoreductase [Kockovaella imperatae]
MAAFPQTFTSTVSHWQATNRGPDALYGHGKTDSLPTGVVDYVIIGAGLSGASLAYHLSRPGVCDDKRIVVLEGKDVASGATGRNGGHIAPYSFASLSGFTRPLEAGGSGLTMDDALDIMKMEVRNLDLVTEIVMREKWDVDLWRGEKLEVVDTLEEKEVMDTSYEVWIEALKTRRDVPDWDWVTDEAEANRVSRHPKAIAFSRGKAGSVHSHKLCTAFMKSALASGRVDLFSWCPVQSIDKGPNEGWNVQCHERGVVRANEVIVCTNGYTRNLFKNHPISDHLSPYRGHATQVTPTLPYSGPGALKHTLCIENGPYLIFTPSSGWVFGVGYADIIRQKAGTHDDVMGATDDGIVPEGIKQWLASYCKEEFEGWGEEAPGEGAQRFWSGIQCASRDRLPLVGQVPGSPGLEEAVGVWEPSDPVMT